ncbi:InlB B-repeat-containing protein, partial [Candidatus Nitrosarchaeum limnium]|uniref:InlB B-repeat-containing protein n=1 Tax=Candidatus Nitrosarchaeum limnium TaxID=1007084 RepID=UPI00064FE6D0
MLFFVSFDNIFAAEINNSIHTNIYELKIKSSPPGLPIGGSGMYADNTWIKTETAQEEWGAYKFVGWKVDDHWIAGNPATILMETDHTAVAIYSLNPAQTSSSTVTTQDVIDGNAFDLTIISQYGETIGSGSYLEGDTANFSVSEQYVYDKFQDGVRYAFSGWSDGNTPNLMSNSIKMKESKTITALWSKQYRLEILDSAQNMKVIKTSWHNEGSNAALEMKNFEVKADEQTRRTLNEWINVGQNSAIITDPQATTTNILMDSPHKISIDWKNQFYLNVISKYGNISGSGFYDEGTFANASIDSEIQDTGIANTRVVFEGWGGDATSDGTSIQVFMDKPKSVTGIWKKQYQLVVDSEYGTTQGSSWYNEGVLASFGITTPRDPAGLWQQRTFLGWEGSSDATTTSGSILMNGPKTVTAKWNVDYSIAFMNISIMSSAAIIGLIIYKKIKNGSRKKIPQKNTNESISIKSKLLATLGLTKNPDLTNLDGRDDSQNNELNEFEIKEIERKKIAEKELEKNLAAVEFERKAGLMEIERKTGLLEIEQAKKALELESKKLS